jgi:hypothetical protein
MGSPHSRQRSAPSSTSAEQDGHFIAVYLIIAAMKLLFLVVLLGGCGHIPKADPAGVPPPWPPAPAAVKTPSPAPPPEPETKPLVPPLKPDLQPPPPHT